MQFTGKSTILKSMMIFQMFPPVLALVAIYALFDNIGKFISWMGIDSTVQLLWRPSGVWLCISGRSRATSDSIDKSLEEAAIVDGATTWQAFLYILLPLVCPSCRWYLSWRLSCPSPNTRLPQCYCSTKQTDAGGGGTTIPLRAELPLGDFAAASVLSGLPITLMFLYCQKWLVGGLTAGGQGLTLFSHSSSVECDRLQQPEPVFCTDQSRQSLGRYF